jgi:hypothetical protein
MAEGWSEIYPDLLTGSDDCVARIVRMATIEWGKYPPVSGLGGDA